MARTPQDVTDTELALLQVLWDGGPATIRRLTGVLYPGGGTAQYATVQKLLERLELKGFIRRERASPAHVFAPTLGRDDLIGRCLNEVAEKLCSGSLTPLLTHLVRTRKLTPRERQELRDLIDELDSKGKGKKGPR
jgi:BlaI family transcriptional regulator, penicillinase repressor